MIIDIHEKIDVSPEWFEKEAQRDGWAERLCQLLAAYKVHDRAGAEKAAEKMIATGIDEELIRTAME